MVSTRHHPQEFPEPDLTPSRSSPSTPSKSTPSRTRKARSSSSATASAGWAHTPSNLTIGWLLISLPLVVWDAGYVLLRPHSMPGGRLHWPLWVPYDLYGKVDHIYGFPAYNTKNGFTAAQTSLNVIETFMYLYYLYVLYAFGRQSKAPGRGAPRPKTIGWLGEQRFVEGREGSIAVLVAFSAAVMTVSKTVLYSEYMTKPEVLRLPSD